MKMKEFAWIQSNWRSSFMGTGRLNEGQRPGLLAPWLSRWHCGWYVSSSRAIRLVGGRRRSISEGGCQASQRYTLQVAFFNFREPLSHRGLKTGWRRIAIAIVQGAKDRGKPIKEVKTGLSQRVFRFSKMLLVNERLQTSTWESVSQSRRHPSSKAAWCHLKWCSSHWSGSASMTLLKVSGERTYPGGPLGHHSWIKMVGTRTFWIWW